MRTLICMLCGLLLIAAIAPAGERGAVVLDIGHQSDARGAASPDGRVNEYEFWCRYAGEVKQVIEDAGYSCLVINRGKAPADKQLRAACAAAGVVQMNKPDRGAKRYPSTHYPEHIGCGMVCADYAIDSKARCVVFLHLNSVGNKWSRKPPAGLIICNRKNGRVLAESVCNSLQKSLLKVPGGIPYADRKVKVLPRYIGSEPSAGWMNALDEAGIPAIVFEAVYVNYKQHVDYICREEGARKLARAIAAGVVDWLRQSE